MMAQLAGPDGIVIGFRVRTPAPLKTLNLSTYDLGSGVLGFWGFKGRSPKQ